MKPRCSTPDSGSRFCSTAAAAWRSHLPPTVSGPSCCRILEPRNSWKTGPSYRQATEGRGLDEEEAGLQTELRAGPWKSRDRGF